MFNKTIKRSLLLSASSLFVISSLTTVFLENNQRIESKFQNNKLDDFANKNEALIKSKTATFLIETKTNLNADDSRSFNNLLAKQKNVLHVNKSEILDDLHFVNFNVENGQSIKTFSNFLDKNQMVSKYFLYFDTNSENVDELKADEKMFFNQKLKNSTSDNDTSFKNYFNSSYQKNFDTNNYKSVIRNEEIENAKKYLDNFNERIGILMTGVGSDQMNGQSDYLIDNTDDFYFDTNNQNTHFIINDYKKVYYREFEPRFGKHTTQLASVIAGKNGINPYHKLYAIRGGTGKKNGKDFINFDRILKYALARNDIKVISSSWGSPEGLGNTNYNIESYYLDRISKENPELIFVFAVGNDGNAKNKEHKKLNDINLSLNNIFVGSNDANLNVSNFSSYGSNSISSGPLLLANGENYAFKSDNGYSTGYSASIISGVLANTLLRYKDRYSLGKNNIIAKTVLAAATKNITNDNQSNQQIGLNANYGAGVLDYLKLSNAFNNLRYISWNNSDHGYINNNLRNINNNELLVASFKLKKNDLLRASLAWEFNAIDFKDITAIRDKTKWLSYDELDPLLKNPIIDNFDLYLKNKTVML
ncbi:S8 family serine peptidase [Mycoplasma sp. E35C]|uniref:S8 family serine peptidase n=1 Tax=Mycoplasma sp. E35C TaxID=2801918 RepID=UPI001CA3B39F|nr:S8 family serine peptidase [Mycoplasma sp. E35C]QZX48960.1 S8 family serine peptidase [Mycoplasma sp. E35C]